MSENKSIVIVSIMATTLIAIAYLTMGKDLPTQPEEPETLTEMLNIEEEVKEWHEVVVLNIEHMPFDQAFNIMRAHKGPNATFLWHGAKYTTMLESEIPVNWIQVGNDVDDTFYCPDNYIDECGVCGGDGVKSWYVDRDGDGFGDPETLIRSCEIPG